MSYNETNPSNLITTSRLGETFLPERNPGSLKPAQLLAWTRFRA